jgi:arsenate reductase
VTQATIYHNPKCSKSRETLALLESKGITPRVIEYLKTPPSAAELDRILKLLDLEPRALMRKNEAEYRDLGLDDAKLSRAQLIKAMVENPRLIERPIVLANARAAIGRPPANITKII